VPDLFNFVRADRASRLDAPTRSPPVISFSSASRVEASALSSQLATRPGNPDFGVVSNISTSSGRLGGAAFVAVAGQISATVSARSPT